MSFSERVHRRPGCTVGLFPYTAIAIVIKQIRGLPRPLMCCAMCNMGLEWDGSASVVYPRVVGEGNEERALLTHAGECMEIAMRALETADGPPLSVPLSDYLQCFLANESLPEPGQPRAAP